MLTSGTVLQGRFRVDHQIGGGGQALVYLVKDTNLGGSLAIKELMPDPNASPQEQQAAYGQFQREARILARLNHPNLPRVWDHFRVGSNAYLVMDYIDGQTLQEIMDQTSGFLPEAAILRWADQLCDVLDYLHQQQPPVIFRDLKPSNVMLDRSDTVKLIDFGIVRHFKAGQTSDTVRMGTPGYAPLEQHGRRQTDARSDIYALGATLYHLLTRHEPEPAPARVLPGQPDPLQPTRTYNPGVRPATEAALTKAMAVAPDKRFQSALEMKQVLQACLSRRPTPPPLRQPTPPQHPMPPPPRQPTLPLQSLLRNRYLVRKLLGQGGMGAVYLAEDRPVFNRLCVVKEMLPYYTTPAERQQAEHNFEREARLLASLRNPGIPQVYDYFIENNRYYLVMEWVEGENLEDHIAHLGGGPLPESEVRDYALQLANILVYIARQNPPVIHRDIKPANIILGGEGQVKLVDFGIAKAITGTGLSTQMSVPLGTPGYVPPEQYSGQVEPRTDVYALGATLHHLLTGRDPRNEPPFQFPPVRSLALGVSPEIAEILTQMLQTDAALRPTPVELRTKLESLLAPPPTAQPQPFAFRSGDVAYNLSELAAACDRRWDEAIEHLYAGDFEPWLEQWNRPDLAVRAASIRRRGGDRSSGLEEFIRAVDHTMPMPALALSQTIIDLGTVERGERRTVRVGVMNAGRGYLHGEFVAGVPWGTVLPRTFGLMAGEQITLRVTVDTSDLDEGPLNQAIFEVRSNGGLEAIVCKADVTWQPQLGLEPKGQLDFDPMLEGKEQPVSAMFVIRNTGGSTLEGQIATSAPWLQLDMDAFRLTSGESLTVTAVAEPSALGIEKAQVAAIQIVTPAGTTNFPARVRVQKTWYTGGSRVRDWLVYGLLVLLGYLGAALPLSVGLSMLLGWPRPGDAIVGVLTAALALSPVGFYLSRRLISRLDEMEDYHYRGSLADELVPSSFGRKKLAWLAGAIAVMGMLLGWRFADWRPGEGTAVWLLAGGLVGGIAGSLLAAEGEPSPALPSAPPWLTSPTYAILRSLALSLTGGMMGLMAGTLVSGRAKPENALIGVLLGLLMSSESHRRLCARLRWLLAHARLGGWMILGAYLAVTALALLQWRQPWTVVAGYGYLGFRSSSLQGLVQLVLLMAAAPLGALGGLWAADSTGQPWAQARRTFLGLVGVLTSAAFLVYLAAVVLVRVVRVGRASDWIAILAVLGASVAAAWGVRERRARIETTLAQTRGAVTQVWDWLKAILPTAGQRTWSALGLTVNWNRVGQRLRLTALRGRVSSLSVVSRLRGWSRPTLAELSVEMTIPLVMGAVGTVVIVQEMLAEIVVGLLLMMGKVALYTLILLGFIKE